MPPATPSTSPERPRRKRRIPAVAVAGAIFVGVFAVLLIGLYLQRGPIGAQLAVSYLRERGVPATIHIDRLDPDGFTGSAVLGDPKNPDLVAPHIEVEFEPIPLLRKGLVAPRIRSIRLVQPRLKARWDGKRLTFGSLQRLVDEAARAPGVGPGPSVAVERGQLRLATPAGVIIADGDGRMNAGRFASLSARVQPTQLRRGGLTLQLAAATITAAARGPSITTSAHLDIPRLSQADLSAQALVADLTAQLPYNQSLRFDGLFSLDARLRAAATAFAGQSLSTPQLNLAFAGASAGPLQAISLKGSGTGSIRAAAWKSPAASAQGLDLAGRLVGVDVSRNGANTRFSMDADLNGLAGKVAAAGVAGGPTRIAARLSGVQGLVTPSGGDVALVPDVTLSAPRMTAAGTTVRDGALELASSRAALAWRAKGWSLSAPLQTRLRAASLTQPVLAGNLALTGFSLRLDGDAALGSGAPRLFLNGSANSKGGALSPAAARAFAAALPLIGTDPVGEAALMGAFRTARLEAPGFNLRTDGGGVRITLARPLQLVGAGGARATVSPLRGGPVAVSVGDEVRGGLVAHLGGARLPELDLEVPLYQAGLDRGGLTLRAETRLTAAFDGATLHELKLAAPARLTRRGGVLSAALGACAPISLSAFGQADMPLLTRITLEACPEPAQPVVTLGFKGWRFGARLKDFQANAPAGEALIRAGQGRIALNGAGDGAPAGQAEITAARVTDGAAMKRFEPIAVTGRLALARDVWTGPLQIFNAAKGSRLATVEVTHTMATSTGSADIAAPALTFAKDGLQPGDLSPVAGTLATDAVGSVDFTGRADWSPKGGVVTRGRLTTTTGIDFRSQFGLVKKATGALTFTSLAPIVTAPGQVVSAEEVSWLVPLTKASGRIAIREDRIAIEQAQATLSGGQVALGPLELLYAPNSPMSGEVRLTQIDLGGLIEQFNLADKLTIDARIDGTIPFAFANGALKLDKGHIFATGPGRLSIKREALTGAVASVAAPPSDAPGAPAPAAPPAVSSGVQDIAYQALENLAFDKLEADLASQPMGRLGILFKINGRNDPPGEVSNKIRLFDLLRGKALESFTLPKGTPVNLTLDTSLNFDELLAAYSQRGRSEPVQQVPAKK